MSISSISGLTGAFQAYAATKHRQKLPGNTDASDPSADIASLVQGASGTVAAAPAAAAPVDQATSDFQSYMKETPAQRMQDAWLQSHGITQQQFNSMSADDKKKVLSEMKQDIEDKMKQKADADPAKSGGGVDVLA